MSELLRVENLKSYIRTPEGTAKAVDDISFDIGRGETFAIVGESGCGKSVTALSIMRLLPQPNGYIASGRILLDGTDLTQLPDEEMRMVRGSKVAMIFQEPMTSLNPVMTIGDQVGEAIALHQHVGARETRERTIDLLERVGIPDATRRYESYPHQMSGGMKQRVMIAMALSCRPALLIADEPTTALDVTIQAQILDLIKDLQREMGTALLLITHDLGVVNQVADRVVVMYAGKIVEMADKKNLFNSYVHPYTIKLFQSLPSRQKRGGELQVIRGMVPRATDFPPGCAFADRCDDAMDVCRTTVPAMTARRDGHRVACHLFTRGGDSAIAPKVTEGESPPQYAPLRDRNGTLIGIEGLKVHFPVKKGFLRRTVGYVKAVDGVDLEIAKGTTVALVGESGCGKTTVARALLRLTKATAGNILYTTNPSFRGFSPRNLQPVMRLGVGSWPLGVAAEPRYEGSADLLRLKASAMRPFRKKLQIVFQDPYSSLNPRMTVGEIVGEGLITMGIGKNSSERMERVRQVMQRVGLDPEMARRYPHEFSGGQRQRIAIARALAVDPEFVICDEATSSLDVSVQAQILNLLKRLQREYGLTYLFITHNLGVVEYLSDRVAVMYLGRIVEHGSVEEVFQDPRHPYTRALLSAVPTIDDSTGNKRLVLEGDIPSPLDPPRGCHFHPRCPLAKDECRGEYPGVTAISPTHAVRCFFGGK